MSSGMKSCKACGKEIAASAKTCPHCGAKQKGKLGLIIGILAVLVIIGAIGGNAGGSKNSSKPANATNTANTPSASTTVEEPEEVEYISTTIAELEEALEKNAMNALDAYKGNYYAITGKLSGIDSDGKYFSIEDPNVEFTFFSIHCSINTDEVKEQIKGVSTGDVITVYGQITDVGEVLGYYLDVDYIE